MFFIKNNCPICRTGMLGVRRCADGKNFVVMCDECETVWASPEHISLMNALDVSPPKFEVAELGVAVAGGLAEWADHEEIDTRGWAKYVKGEQVTHLIR
ncbi:hypothetical protein [Noviherbaspirillum suwonense]|uniref:hypothetical protein n=1 Tax=Noviherbaspirillum suwonense TaxID=1224511 RepID=UPI0024B696E3|nr:hypothetical protein [Noviherbaspirillum suwonense]